MAAREPEVTDDREQSAATPTLKEKQSTPRSTARSAGAGSNKCCGKHLLALLPILLGLVIYNIPTIMDEYEASFG